MTSERTIDPMDRYSKPIEVQETKLGKFISLEPRKNPEKPGRSLRVIFDTRFPLAENFRPEYAYTVTFDEAGNQAGNHYHHKKSELFYPIAGVFEVQLENPSSKESETIVLNSDTHDTFYIKAGVAHKVTSKSDKAVLLVVATSPNIDNDEFHYML